MAISWIVLAVSSSPVSLLSTAWINDGYRGPAIARSPLPFQLQSCKSHGGKTESSQGYDPH